MPARPMLNIKEAANFLGVKPVTLRKWDRGGKLKAIRIGSRQDRRYPIELLSGFLDNSNQRGKKIEWQEYLRGKIAVNVIWPIIEGPTSRLEKYWGINYLCHLSYGNENFCYWCCDRKDNVAVGERVLQLFAKKSFASRIQQTWLRMLEEMREFSDEIYRTSDLSSLSDSKLIALYNEAVEASAEYEGMAFCIDGLDEVGPSKIAAALKDIFSKQSIKEVDFNKAFNLFTSPSVLSVVARRDWEVAEIAKMFVDKKINREDANQKLSELVLHTWWQDMGWAMYEPHTDEVLENFFEELLRDGKLEAKIGEWNKYVAGVESEKKRLIKILGLGENSEFLQTVQIVDKFVILHDWRKEFQMRELYVQMKLLGEIAKRLAIPFIVLEWATPEEVKKIFAGEKLNLPDIYQRARGFIILLKDGRRWFLTGKEAEKVWQEEREKLKEGLCDISGLSASRGKAVGIVFVALSADEAEKVSAGQVLVTGMTTPEFVPAMRKAVAIVTDEGGLTCHAAIIARELGKPCIVGTKYATRILRTGQTVEVAANHGVVRILNK